MSALQYQIDATTRHQVFVQRFADGEAKKAVKQLNRLRRDIIGRLSGELTDFNRKRLSAILADIDIYYRELSQNLTAQLESNLTEFALSESEFQQQLLSKVSTASYVLPPESVLAAAVRNEPISAGAVNIADELSRYGSKKAKEVNQIIRDGIALGETTPTIARNVSTRISTLQRRQLQTLVRTATNSASNKAKSEFRQANSRFLDGYRWISTLDNGTTLICASRDQEVYQEPYGPKPSAHWGCRSTTIDEIKDEFKIPGFEGQRPAVGPDGASQVGARTTYGSWLKNQPVEFIDEALGVERSRLFRSGKLSIDKFVDPTGRVYTLDQLRRMNPFVFQEF